MNRAPFFLPLAVNQVLFKMIQKTNKIVGGNFYFALERATTDSFDKIE